MTAATDQITEQLTAFSTRAKDFSENAFTSFTEVIENTVTTAFDVAEQALAGQRAFVTGLLPKS